MIKMVKINDDFYINPETVIIAEQSNSTYKLYLESGRVIQVTKEVFDDVKVYEPVTLVDGKIPSSVLPSYVDDVVEYASASAFPATGEAGKIYVALDTNFTYRWSGSAYVRVNEVDLSNYYTKTQVDTALGGKASLSGNNTFTGKQVFNDGTKDVSVFDLGSIYFRDLDKDLDDLFTEKQDALTFDNAPTQNSSNPVKSGGVYTALNGKQDSLTFDNAPTQSSNNPVTSGGVYTALGNKAALASNNTFTGTNAFNNNTTFDGNISVGNSSYVNFQGAMEIYFSVLFDKATNQSLQDMLGGGSSRLYQHIVSFTQDLFGGVVMVNIFHEKSTALTEEELFYALNRRPTPIINNNQYVDGNWYLINGYCYTEGTQYYYSDDSYMYCDYMGKTGLGEVQHSTASAYIGDDYEREIPSQRIIIVNDIII